MTARSIRVVAFFALGVLAVLLAFGRSSRTEATSPTTSTYDYKVELVKHKKVLEGRLRENGRIGWRLQSVVAMPSNSELVVIQEKANTP